MLNKILNTIIILFIIVKMCVTSMVGSCNQCFGINKIACLDETHFATCFQGSPISTKTKCPANRFCTDDVLICRSSVEGYTPICYHDNCGDCEVTDGVFTCLDETTYGYCFGGKTPLEGSLRSCPKGFVCNFNSRAVCVPENTHKPSCTGSTTTATADTTITTEISTIPTESTTDETTTITTTDATATDQTTTTKITSDTTNTPTTQETTSTTVVPRDANTICREIGKTGYFKSDDPTCREYVYCYLLSEQYLGWFYYCDRYFNAATQKCQTQKPLDCIAY